VDGLEETFAGLMDVVILNWDDPSLDSIRAKLAITDRSQYVLVDQDGTVLKRWYGPLYEEQITQEIQSFLQ